MISDASHITMPNDVEKPIDSMHDGYASSYMMMFDNASQVEMPLISYSNVYKNSIQKLA